MEHVPGGCSVALTSGCCSVPDPRLWRRLPASVEDLAPQLEKPEKLAGASRPLAAQLVTRLSHRNGFEVDFKNCRLEEKETSIFALRRHRYSAH